MSVYETSLICDGCGASESPCRVDCPSGGLDPADLLLHDLRVLWGEISSLRCG